MFFGSPVLYCTIQISDRLKIDIRKRLKGTGKLILNKDYFDAAVVTNPDKATLRDFFKYVNTQLQLFYRGIFNNYTQVNNSQEYIYVTDSSDSLVFMYRYKHYEQFSNVTLSILLSLNLIALTESKMDSLPMPIQNCSDHEALRPFFLAKGEIINYYEEMKLQDVQRADFYQQNIDAESTRESARKRPLPDLSIHSRESHWTKRLFDGIKVHFPDINPILTMDMAKGGGFAKKILSVWSQILDIPVEIVPFRGSPDITTAKRAVINIVDTPEPTPELEGAEEVEGEDSGSETGSETGSDTRTMELSPLTFCSQSTYCPEKMGELTAAMMTKMYCGLLKSWSNKKNFP